MAEYSNNKQHMTQALYLGITILLIKSTDGGSICNFTYDILEMNFKWWVDLHWHHHLERESRKDKIFLKDLFLMQPHCTKRPLLSEIYQNFLNETKTFTIFLLYNIYVYKKKHYQNLQP